MLGNIILKTTTALALAVGLAGAAFAEPVTIRVVAKDLLTTNPEDVAHIARIEKALWPQTVSRLENYPYLIHMFPARSKAPLIRTDWLAKTGLDAPQTLDEWTALMRVLAKSDYDGDGKQNTYAIMAPGNTKELDAVFNQAFGITGTWLQKDGQWIDARVSDQERAKLTYYRMLYADGLLDPEFITKNWEVKEDDLYAGKVAIVMGTAGPVVGIYLAKMR